MSRRWYVLGGIVLLALVASGVMFSRADKKSSRTTTSAGESNTACTPDQRFDPGNGHVANPVYRLNPPSGGDHDPRPAPPDIYTKFTEPADGQIVHSMEHGYVILWHKPKISSQESQELNGLFSAFPTDILVVPRSDLPVPFAATAWHHRLLCRSMDVVSLKNFVEMYRNQGPERIPH